MAKLQNELDISAAIKNARANEKNWNKVFINLSPVQKKALQTLVNNTSVKCLIFAQSIAFRIGKSSIKTIPSYNTGFKGGIPARKTASDMFLNTSVTSNFNVTKDSFVFVAAVYFLLNYPDRVSTESDKTEAAESAQISFANNKFKSLIKEYGSVRLMVGDSIYEVDKFTQATGRAKADAYFSYKGTPLIFLSLKNGGKPANFQQYGGIKDLGISGDNFSEYPEIQTYVEEINSIFESLMLSKSNSGKYDFNAFKKGTYFGKFIKNKIVAGKVIFGKNFGDRKFGMDNCNATIDGDLVFKPVKGKLNIFELDGEFHISVNPKEYKVAKQLSLKEGDIYSPVMMMVKSESQGLSSLGFSNVRFYIWPNNSAASLGRSKFNKALDLIKDGDINTLKETILK